MNLLAFFSDGANEYNSSEWTLSTPTDSLRRLSDSIPKSSKINLKLLNIAHWLRNTTEAQKWCNWADIITIQRVVIDESIERTVFWKQRGKAVALTWDDGYNFVDESNPAAAYWSRGTVTVNTPYGSYESKLDKHPLDQFKVGLRECAGGIVPSRILANDWRQYSPVFYLPNYPKSRRYVGAIRKKSDYIVLGFGGSLGHKPSFTHSGILPALSRIIREYDNARLLLIGDRRIADLVPIAKSKLIYQNYVPYHEWPNTLAQMTISLAPLSQPFDMRRSMIKCMEAALMGIPLVTTGDALYTVYKDFYGTPGMVFVPSELTIDSYDQRAELWYQSLKMVIDNLPLYQQRAKESIEIGMEWDVDRNAPNILKVYEQILELV